MPNCHSVDPACGTEWTSSPILSPSLGPLRSGREGREREKPAGVFFTHFQAEGVNPPPYRVLSTEIDFDSLVLLLH